MKKLLLSAILAASVLSLKAQNFYPSGSQNNPTWYFSDVNAIDDGNFYNPKTGKNGNGISEGNFRSSNKSYTDAYDTAFEFFVGTEDSVYTESGQVDTVETSFFMEEQLIDGFYVSRNYYFSPTDPVVRADFKIRNPKSSARSTKIGIQTNFGSDEDTQLDSCTSGGSSLSDPERWMITSDGGPYDPVNTFVRFGPGYVVSSPVFGLTPVINEDYFLDTFAISVPANSYVLILQFARLDTSVATAKANVYKFNSITSLQTAGYLTGLDADAKSKVVNWNFTGATAIQNATDVSNQVSIYPVPASQSVNLNLGNAFDGTSTVEIKDMTGVTSLKTQINGNTSLDISSLESGLYVVEIRNNEKLAYKKLIKN